MRIPILLLALLWQPGSHAVSMTIGTGGEQGIYYQVIKEFCRLAHKSDPTLQCKPQASSGSIENLRQLQAKEMALSQLHVERLTLE
ncbi:TAXI family TRAP transporter solute-binding subunit [Aeromonas rivipollensis]|uniref:TAXI family TRAP transporter solute-binding subunit n=1 Tax=Aeromonas rivipollensis TaxID=948519 RepID=UPI0038CF3767